LVVLQEYITIHGPMNIKFINRALHHILLK